MRRRNAIKYDEDKIYAFTGTQMVQDQYKTQYKKEKYNHILVLGADRVGVNQTDGKGYNDFIATSLTPGKQILLHFDSFSNLLEELNDKHIDLLIFDTVIEFILWFMKESLKLEKPDPDALLEMFKEHMTKELEQMVELHTHGSYFSQGDGTDKGNNRNNGGSHEYGCDNCGWVYNDTSENKSFEELGKYFICPECGGEKVNFTKLN